MADRSTPFSASTAVALATSLTTIHTVPAADVGSRRGAIVKMLFVNDAGAQDLVIEVDSVSSTIALASKASIEIEVWAPAGTSVRANASATTGITVFGWVREV